MPQVHLGPTQRTRFSVTVAPVRRKSLAHCGQVPQNPLHSYIVTIMSVFLSLWLVTVNAEWDVVGVESDCQPHYIPRFVEMVRESSPD